jgi:type IV pilus assembly protein PilO
MAIQTGLEGKPAWQGALVGLLCAAALVGGGYYFKFSKQYAELERMEQQLAGLQQKIQEGRAAKAKLPQFREEVRRLELELEKLLRILPARRNTPELLRRIRQLTEQGNFSLLKFTPGNFVDREFYSEWPIAVRLNGTYHNLALFFDRIGRFSRIINIENLKISALPRSPEGHTIAATFTAKTFIYKETAEEPAASTAPAGGPGR